MMIFNLLPRLSSLIVMHSGSLNSNNIVYLSSDLFSGFLNNILFVWPLFGLFLESILPETPYPEQSTKGYGLWGSRLYASIEVGSVLEWESYKEEVYEKTIGFIGDCKTFWREVVSSNMWLLLHVNDARQVCWGTWLIEIRQSERML